MKTLTLTAALTLASATLLSGVALAAPVTAELPEFDQVNRDNDGVITKYEAVQANMPAELFVLADRNGDDVLLREEYSAIKAQTLPKTAAK